MAARNGSVAGLACPCALARLRNGSFTCTTPGLEYVDGLARPKNCLRLFVGKTQERVCRKHDGVGRRGVWDEVARRIDLQSKEHLCSVTLCLILRKKKIWRLPGVLPCQFPRREYGLNDSWLPGSTTRKLASVTQARTPKVLLWSSHKLCYRWPGIFKFDICVPATWMLSSVTITDKRKPLSCSFPCRY